MSEYECAEHLHDEIQRLREANYHLRERAEEQKQRIKRLEDAGDAMAQWLNSPRNLGGDSCLVHQWNKAKEAKP